MQLALLHDVIEDPETTESELEAKFGIIIPVYVKALTKNKGLPKGEQMIDSLNRIKKLPHEVWAVKLADRITNLQSPPSHWGMEKKVMYLNEAIMILDALKEGNNFLAHRLMRCIENYQKYLN